jgi:hypothetical protein
MMAMHRLQDGQQHHSIGGQTPAEKEKLVQEVEQYKKEAERVRGSLCSALCIVWCSSSGISATSLLG